MATVVGGGKVKLSNGQVVNAQEGGWYDGQQYFGGSLGSAGVINNPNQQGYGQAVSREVVAQTNPNNVAYLQQQNPQAAPSGSTGGMPTGGGGLPGGGLSGGMPAPATLNLPELYKSLYASSGIGDLETQLSKNTEAYNQRVSQINDNPFLSEASRTGRQQKLSIDFDNRVANLKNDIATKKADIETQLNLQTKQFDINSQAAQQALSQFNTLLQMGALDNASGEDIANITRSTGLSSSAIYSAIKANQAKNVQTQVISYDDGSDQGFAVINAQTGEIISRQSVASSKPTKSGGGSGKLTKDEERQGNIESLTQSVKSGVTLKKLVDYYSQVLGIEDIYRIYNSYSPYGQAKETLAEAKQGVFKAL